MIALNAHFDGKVIVPDSPLNLPANQRVRVQLEPIPSARTDFRKWIGLGKTGRENPDPQFTDDSSLWE